MRATVVAVGLTVVAAAGGVALYAYSHLRADCATDLFTGNATDPGGCASNQTLLGASLLLGVLAAAATILVLILARHAESPRPAAPAEGDDPGGAGPGETGEPKS